MSDEMAVGDNASKDEHKVDSSETKTEALETADASELPEEPSAPEPEATSELIKDEPVDEIKEGPEENDQESEITIKEDTGEAEEVADEKKDEVVRGIKRRASSAFSDTDEEFKGFDSTEQSSLADYSRIVEEERKVKRRSSTSSNDEFKGFDLTEHNNLTGYCQVLERLEAEVSAAVKSYTPVRTVMASPAVRANKRARQDTGGCTKWSEHLEAEVTALVRTFSDETDETAVAGKRGTDSSRPSSALSSRSDGDGAFSTDASMSPAARGGRRTTAEMSSPALRVPLEHGWRRELVYRATNAADGTRRNADIYYYTPRGKKLRSTREVAEHLAGTGLTLENFSFFKEPLGIDDPEKEIIRDAKVIRRVESPVPAAPPPVVDGKRTPKPKAPKGASPEPATPKSPPAKLKVKSMGSRLSSNGTTPKPAKKALAQQQTPTQQPTTPADNNNSAAWKKPRGPSASHPSHTSLPSHQTHPSHPSHQSHPLHPSHPPPPLQPRPPHVSHNPAHVQVAERESIPVHHHQLRQPQPPQTPQQPRQQRGSQRPVQQAQAVRQSQQPCSMACGRGAVPSLACDACLCLYHPACVGLAYKPTAFLCKNCRKSSSPPLEPPQLTHKSGVPSGAPSAAGAGARRMPVPVPVPVPVPKNDKRVTLRMKAAGGPGGARVWAVAGARPVRPQSLAVLQGRRFIVVTRETLG